MVVSNYYNLLSDNEIEDMLELLNEIDIKGEEVVCKKEMSKKKKAYLRAVVDSIEY